MSDHIEGRDWIGNPDGTLVYWQVEAEAARAKLDRIAALRVEDYGDPYWVFRDLRKILEIDA